MFAKSVIDWLRYNDWTFSGTSEFMVAALLVLALVITMLGLIW